MILMGGRGGCDMFSAVNIDGLSSVIVASNEN